MNRSRFDHDHSRDGIHARLSAAPEASYLRDWVYGGIDGAVTTFAIIAGIVGAGLDARIILIIGIASVLADGFSMASGNYLATKAERDERDHLVANEARHIRLYPDGEREEVRQILAAKGLKGETLEGAVQAVTANERTWIELMLKEEFGVAAAIRAPERAAVVTFLAFALCGTVPLLPFVFAFPAPFFSASILVAVVFFAIGSLKSHWMSIAWWKSGLETLAIGLVAACVAYGVGVALEALTT